MVYNKKLKLRGNKFKTDLEEKWKAPKIKNEHRFGNPNVWTNESLIESTGSFEPNKNLRLSRKIMEQRWDMLKSQSHFGGHDTSFRSNAFNFSKYRSLSQL